EWLMIGKGSPYPKDVDPSRRDFNREVYDMIAQLVERIFSEMGVQVAAGTSAATIIDCYDDVMDITRSDAIEEYRSLMPWLEYGLRQQARHH
ncbi:hypothetical protein JZU71_01375, partial [bacterium]|nr:hypothetical protein [bacterium]